MLNRIFAEIRRQYLGFIALMLAVTGGTAWAANEWTGDNVVDGSLSGADIQDLSLGTNDYGIGSVFGSRIKDDGVLGSHLVNGTVTRDDVEDNSLTGADILTQSITGPDLFPNTLTRDEIASSSVDAPELDDDLDDTITTNDIGAGAVTSSEIAASSVFSNELAPDSVGASEISTAAVGADEIGSGVVGSSEIATGGVGAGEVSDGSLGLADMKAGRRDGDSLDLFQTAVNQGACSAATNASAPSAGTTPAGAFTIASSETNGWRVEGEVTTTGAARVRLCNETGANVADAPPVTFNWITLAP